MRALQRAASHRLRAAASLHVVSHETVRKID
jgi:hypothetical protein